MSDITHDESQTRGRRVFSPAENWDGGDFELRLVYDPEPLELLTKAFEAVWSHPAFHGCYVDRFPEPELQPRIDAETATTELNRPWYGVATLPSGALAACRSTTYSGRTAPPEITIGIPMGALHGSYDTGAYPFTDARPLGWRIEVSDWLADIGASIHDVAPFRFGLIKHEATLDGVET